MDIKRIETQSQKEKKDRINKIVIGIILVALMIVSTAGYAVMDRGKQEKVKYNGFTFERTEQGWQTNDNNIELLTRFNPLEVKNISYKLVVSSSDYNGENVFFEAYTSEERDAANEIAGNIAATRVQLACIKENENLTECNELPLKDCSKDKVFIIKTSNNNETSIKKEDNCVFVTGNGEELLKATDRFIFSLYKIITD